MKGLTRQDVLDLFDKYIAVSGAERRKLSTHVISTIASDDEQNGGDDMADVVNQCGQEIKDVNQFKGNLPLHSLIQPFVNLNELRR